MFYELGRKDGYEKKGPKAPVKQTIREGLKELKNEIRNWTNEVKESMEFDPLMQLPLPGYNIEHTIDFEYSFNYYFFVLFCMQVKWTLSGLSMSIQTLMTGL